MSHAPRRPLAAMESDDDSASESQEARLGRDSSDDNAESAKSVAAVGAMAVATCPEKSLRLFM